MTGWMQIGKRYAYATIEVSCAPTPYRAAPEADQSVPSGVQGDYLTGRNRPDRIGETYHDPTSPTTTVALRDFERRIPFPRDGARRQGLEMSCPCHNMYGMTLPKWTGNAAREVTIKTGISFSSKPNPIKGIVFDVQLVRVQCRVVCAISNVHVRIEAANAASIVGTPSPPAHEGPRRYAGYPGALTQRVMHRASGMRADDFAGIDVDEVPSASRSRRGH